MLRIGESLPAVNLDLVAEPSKGSKEIPPPPPTPKEITTWEFFKGLRERVEKKYPELRPTKRREKPYWISFLTSVRGILVTASFCKDRREYGLPGPHLRVELWIDTGQKDRNKEILDSLHSSKNQIEEELGERLVWERMDDRRASRIAVYKPGSIQDPEQHLEELKEWAVEEVAKLHKVFNPRLLQVAGRG